MSASALCPVCGMETRSVGGPQVSMQHGGQAIHTCSMYHAHQVVADISLYHETSSAATGTASDKKDGEGEKETAHDFCTGPGTTMLNGFSFSSGPTPCILLWFPGWTLSSRVTYLLGCLAVAVCAIFNEYLLHVRRLLRKESNRRKLRAVSGQAAIGGSAEALFLVRSSSICTPGILPCLVPHAGARDAAFRALPAPRGHDFHRVHAHAGVHDVRCHAVCQYHRRVRRGPLFVWPATGFRAGWSRRQLPLELILGRQFEVTMEKTELAKAKKMWRLCFH